MALISNDRASAVAQVDAADALLRRAEDTLEIIKGSRLETLRAFLEVHGPTLSDGRFIEPGKGGSLRIVRRATRGTATGGV